MNKILKSIKDYKLVEGRIKATEILLKQIDDRLKQGRGNKQYKNNGLESRLGIKLDVLKQLRYDLESKSVIVRTLSLLRII
jgi:hypothetical protein